MGALLYLKVQSFSSVQSCLLIIQILQNIHKNHKIHLFYALVYFDKAWHYTNCGCVFDCCRMNPPWMPLIAHSQATMEVPSPHGWGIICKVQQLLRVEFTIIITLFWATRSWNCFPFCIGLSPHPSQLHYLVWSRSNFYRIDLEASSSMIWWCNYNTSLGPSLLWNADILAIPDCIYKSAAAVHWEKGHDTAYKIEMTLGMKRKIIQCKFPIDCICHVVSICHVKFVSVERVVWGHIEIAESETSIRVSCLLCFQYWGCGMKQHPWNLCTLCWTKKQ